MFHKEGKHVKGLKLEELNVLGEMKSWSAMVGGGDGHSRHCVLQGLVHSIKEFGFENMKSF